jgi:hypothetical protein
VVKNELKNEELILFHRLVGSMLAEGVVDAFQSQKH